MNKRLIKTIASVTCGLGIASSIPFITTSCGSSKHTLVIDYKIEDIYGIVGGDPISTLDLSQYVHIDSPSGEQVTGGLTFSIDPKPDGLSINPDTGEISWEPDKFSYDTYQIKVSTTIGGHTLEGTSNDFTIDIDKFIPDGVLSEEDLDISSNMINGFKDSGNQKVIEQINNNGCNAIKFPETTNQVAYMFSIEKWPSEVVWKIKTLELSRNIAGLFDSLGFGHSSLFSKWLNNIIIDSTAFTIGGWSTKDTDIAFSEATNVRSIEIKNIESIANFNLDAADNNLTNLGKDIKDGTGKVIFKDDLDQSAKQAIFDKLVAAGLDMIKWSIK